ncbi:MMPL family transporter [Marinitoga sp. 1138]|uniref:efflux RND transporter permease subunit n=1 Tax=Marinitoga sp. 1138 TaxID=1643334 RepID=UPI0015869543|nr:hypothetical protein [Marinitoga sp. 1138]
MKKLGKIIIEHSKVVFALMMVLTLVALYFTTKLYIKPGFLDLLPADDPYVQVYKEASKSFKSIDNIMIGIEGNKEDIIKYIDAISSKLKTMDGVDAIYARNPMDFMKKNIFLLSPDEQQKFLLKLYSSENIVDFFDSLNQMFETPDNGYHISEQEKRQFNYILDSFNNLLVSINNNDIEAVKQNFQGMLFGKEYMISDDGKFGIVIVRPGISFNDLNRTIELVNKIEKVVKDEAKNYNVKAGLTGTAVIERDEMVTTERDMAITTTVSVILILIIFYLGFRSFKFMILSIIPLITGIILALGYAKITIGSLNIMTVMMGAILAGLGIDYSIHIISLYLELRSKGNNVKDALYGVFEKNVRGIVAGAVTTAIVMGIFIISEFPGFREFGIVLSAGIIFTLISAITILPILLKWFGKSFKDPGKTFVIDYDIKKYRMISIILLVVLIIFSAVKITKVQFEKNMLEIEAKGLESIAINNKILEEFELSPDNTIFISNNLAEAKMLYEKIKNVKVFSEVDSIIPFIPETEKQVVRLKNAKTVKSLYVEPINFDMNKLKNELRRLNLNMLKASLSLNTFGYKDLGKKVNEIVKSGIINKLMDKNYEDYLAVQKTIISQINLLKKDLNDSEFITIDKIPEEIKSNYVSDDGKVLTTVYPAGDIWNADFQKEYFKILDGLNVDNVTGTSLLFYKVVKISAEEGKNLLILTLILIFVVLLIDLRSLKYSILALLPMLLAIVLMLGIMGWFDIKFNVVNIIALPLIIGIGVDDGIHLIHRYRREKNLREALRSTGKAITMTTLTTGAAFGSFVLAKYRGFVGFGLLLLMGVIFSFLITAYVITSIISYMESKDNKESN